MLCKTAKNRLIKISTNFSSPILLLLLLPAGNQCRIVLNAGGNFLNAPFVSGISKKMG